MVSLTTSKKFRVRTPKCLACSHHRDAEMIHPMLKIPMCGACNLTYKQRDMSTMDGKNENSCVMCGTGDDNELLMCDMCQLSFCAGCITRNFGDQELLDVRNADPWYCYMCTSDDDGKLASLQVPEDTIFYNLDRSYALVKPPSSVQFDQSIIALFSEGEALFASLFSAEVSNQPFVDLNIISYLGAADLLPKMFCLSKNLRTFFKSRNFFLPGLFRTPFGQENMCRLHPHQVVSLHTMSQIENRDTNFGALRGGIFADEPGLGKTVTALALISSTAGTMPNRPALFWDEQVISEAWHNLRSSHERTVAPLLNKLRKLEAMNLKDNEMYETIKKGLRQGVYSLPGFEKDMKRLICRSSHSMQGRDTLISLFNFEMNNLKESLDPSSRKSLSSMTSRACFERKLYPSSATLIIVPLALLEHWYEQILRHLDLRYFLHAEDRASMRGVVYLDGLGDIVDVEAPLSKLLVRASVPIETERVLSSYLIVVTTLERCSLEHQALDKTGRSAGSAINVSGNNKQKKNNGSSGSRNVLMSSAEESPLLKIRWLRLIIDEGHEIGRLRNDPSVTRAFADAAELITHIAAERRWIMSGTPTTGAHSDVGLHQLFRLLSFLRHPHYTVLNNEKDWNRSIIEPCLLQNPAAWAEVEALLRQLMVRHTKQDIDLYPPIYVTCNMEGISDPDDNILEQRSLRSDRAKANYIAETMRKAYQDWSRVRKSPDYVNLHEKMRRASTSLKPSEQELLFKARRPKAIVFSQHKNDLQGVGHFLYMMLGDNDVCEHIGQYSSAELSRFRHSKRKFRVCPLCGNSNSITSGDCCDKVLLLVEYQDVVPPPMPATTAAATSGATSSSSSSSSAAAAPPSTSSSSNSSSSASSSSTSAFSMSDQVESVVAFPAGHGYRSAGGHYVGHCLCSRHGCFGGSCTGYRNPFYRLYQQETHPNYALINESDVVGYLPGLPFQLNQEVFVTSAPGQGPRPDLLNIDDAATPKLWFGGRRGGRATIRQWRRCGGRSADHSWHGNKVLPDVPWTVEEEKASVMLLLPDGSTGLDLSFATHIFLLERIHDPALKSQIVSRAHRVGATGPVLVSLLQVVAADQSD